jgi:glycosyltransferase involved in cell wall biosynthesis
MIHYSDFALDSRVQRHAYALAARGDEVDAICLSPPQEIRVGDGVIRLHRVGAAKVRSGAWAQLRAYARFCLRAATRLERLQRTAPFDVVEAHNMPNAVALAALGAKLRGTPVVLDVHDTFPELYATKFTRVGRAFMPIVYAEERLSAAASDALICVTGDARERLATRGVGLGKASVVMNSPDEAVFGPPRPPVTIPATGTVRAVYHGGIAPRFGVDRLVRAFGILQRRGFSRARLDVHGSFEDFREFAQLAGDLSPKRVLLAQAPTPFREIPGVLADKHIGIVPTLDDRFTELLLPVKLLEYVHMGIPVIASRLRAIARCFGEREVRFVEPGSPEALADAVEEVCAHPQDAAVRAARASERLAEIRWARQRTTYLALVDRLAGLRSRRGRRG